MTDSGDVGSVSPLMREFCQRFATAFPTLAYTEVFSEQLEIRIPPKHPDVGALCVRDDGDELTMLLGPHHHWHLPTTFFDDSPSELRADLTAQWAVDQIRALLEDRLVLRVRWNDGKVRSSTTYAVDHPSMKPASGEEREYVWSGPRESPT